jgi:cytochrome c oxidase subunit 3
MATTVTSTERVVEQGIGAGPGFPPPSGNGGNGWHRKEHGGTRRFSGKVYRVTTWVVLAAVVMMFAALSAAYLVLSGGDQGRAIRMPKVFFWSTAIIIGSTAMMESARRSLKRENGKRYSWSLLATLLLGISFLGSQLLGWQELVAQGVYLSGQPGSSFFYLFTGLHGIHVVGGILALSYLVFRNHSGWSHPDAEKKKASNDVVSLYWHFMGGLWVWLFLLLLIWR